MEYRPSCKSCFSPDGTGEGYTLLYKSYRKGRVGAALLKTLGAVIVARTKKSLQLLAESLQKPDPLVL